MGNERDWKVNQKMRKRLRKKLHLGEFTEWGRELKIVLNNEDDFDGFLDDFIVDAIEANGCSFGGYGTEGIVQLGRVVDDPEGKFEKIAKWLDSRDDVKNWTAGEEIDIWK